VGHIVIVVMEFDSDKEALGFVMENFNSVCQRITFTSDITLVNCLNIKELLKKKQSKEG